MTINLVRQRNWVEVNALNLKHFRLPHDHLTARTLCESVGGFSVEVLGRTGLRYRNRK